MGGRQARREGEREGGRKEGSKEAGEGRKYGLEVRDGCRLWDSPACRQSRVDASGQKHAQNEESCT